MPAPQPAAPPRVAVAVSGGPDSLALLHATWCAARGLGVDVLALHVHHGLQPAADGWLHALERRCRRWQLSLAWTRLETRPAPGDSVQAWARRERYAALARMAHAEGCSLVLLAQHRRDQAETFLLQALRGGGPAGLASMARRFERDGLVWMRPWLDQDREAIEAYLRRHRLRAIDDPANHDPRYGRSRLRQQVWPALAAAFPHAEVTLATAAARAAEAADLMAEVAGADLAAAAPDGPLRVPALLALSPARRANLLRAWLAGVLAGPVPETLVARLVAELPARGASRWPAERAGVPGFVWLRRRSLVWEASPVSGAPESRP